MYKQVLKNEKDRSECVIDRNTLYLIKVGIVTDSESCTVNITRHQLLIFWNSNQANNYPIT